MAEQDFSQPPHPRSASENEAAPATGADHGVSINLPPGAPGGRPAPVKHMSAPAYQSPIRHHQRTPSRTKGVKETLNARSSYGSGDDEGAAVHRINQYTIKQEIGRGSFGSVHLAEDQYGNEYAVKEFSKSRLRKRAQSNLLRKPNQGRRPGHLAAGLGFNSPLHRLSSEDKTENEGNNSLSLIKEEIAIMKKLNHNNLVSLIEVLDDPKEDSLYMVLEMCKKGVAMKVGLDERAEPYDDETCRCWFRDMILGIEYLHAQGIIHRDIKPDNCLITGDDVLKIVDFGVSEMFEKQSDMATAKSAGSPAFMPPELCVARHGQVSGRAADVWSMGVTLYCLRYGHIPFEKSSMIELYDSIRGDDIPLDGEQDKYFADLMQRILRKDPETRITMDDLRTHPWVTKGGTDTLLSAEENCADIIEPPTEAEMDQAITGNMSNLLVVMKAVKRFRTLVESKRPRIMGGIFGRESRLVSPPHSIRHTTRSENAHDRRPLDKVLVTEGIHRPIGVDDDFERLAPGLDEYATRDPALDLNTPHTFLSRESGVKHKQRMETDSHRPSMPTRPDEHRKPLENQSRSFPLEDHAKGHAHDPLEDEVYLSIGHDPEISEGDGDFNTYMVSESPPAVDMNIYEQAYQDEMQRILEKRGEDASMYMTRRIEHRDDIRLHDNIKDAGKHAARRAAKKFDGLSKTTSAGYATFGDAGRHAARIAAGKFQGGSTESSGSASEAFEAGKQAAKSFAKDSLDISRIAARSATERLGSSSKTSAPVRGLSDMVKRAQAQARDDAGTTAEQAKISTPDSQPQETDGAIETPEPASQPQDTPKRPAPEHLDDTHMPSVPGAFPTTLHS